MFQLSSVLIILKYMAKKGKQYSNSDPFSVEHTMTTMSLLLEAVHE